MVETEYRIGLQLNWKECKMMGIRGVKNRDNISSRCFEEVKDPVYSRELLTGRKDRDWRNNKWSKPILWGNDPSKNSETISNIAQFVVFKTVIRPAELYGCKHGFRTTVPGKYLGVCEWRIIWKQKMIKKNMKLNDPKYYN